MTGSPSLMHSINQDTVPWVEQRSPSGKFCVYRKHLSIALGGRKDIGPTDGGHPFDLELARIPPGAINWPFHSHAAQWELFVVVAGTGQARSSQGFVSIAGGDCILFRPGEPHQLMNTGGSDLVYYVIADQPLADLMSYPDSGKWLAKPQRKAFRMQEVDYYDAEDEPDCSPVRDRRCWKPTCGR